MIDAGVTDVVVAVDGGGTKTDTVVVGLDGRLRGHRRGAGSSPHFEGLDAAVAVVDTLVTGALADAESAAGPVRVVQTDLYVSGLDLPVEIDAYRTAVAGCAWAVDGFVVDNDLFALLWSGSAAADAIAVVCGTGINAVGVRADGETVRFLSLGELSGDWGGGSGLGLQALWHAARAVDGRGPATSLVDTMCVQLGVDGIPALIEQLHLGQRDHSELTALAPAVFRDAAAGDAVAGGLVDRQADEVVAFVRAIAHRLDLGRAAPAIVLGGSILRAGHPRLDERIARGVAELVPDARIERPAVVPVVGAALAAARRAGADDAALVRLREELKALS